MVDTDQTMVDTIEAALIAICRRWIVTLPVKIAPNDEAVSISPSMLCR
jgi:hypothetical protein